MAKNLITKQVIFSLCDKRNKAKLTMNLPMQYSLADIIYIISEYTGYRERFAWNIYNPYDKEKAIIDTTMKSDLVEINFAEFRGTTPDIVFTYGSVCILVGARGAKKSSKVYPFNFKGIGYFPDEDDIRKEEVSEKEIYDYEYLTDLATDLRMDIPYRSDERFVDFQTTITKHFKDKYKLSDEVVSGFYSEENKLVLK